MFSNSKFATDISALERYVLLFINLITITAYGVLAGSFGVTFETLQSLFGLTTSEVSAGFSLQAVGGCISALIATFTLDKFNRQIQFSIVILVLGIISIVMPFSLNLLTFLVINSGIGFLCTLIDCITNAWVVELFRPQEHVFVQILHFFFALGSTISPFMLGPFLNRKKPQFDHEAISTKIPFNDGETNSDVVKNSASSINPAIKWISNQTTKSEIWKPFAMLGVSMLVIAAMHFFVYFIKPYKEINSKANITKAQQENNLIVLNQDMDKNSNSLEKSSNNLVSISCGHEKKSKNLSKGYYIFFVGMIVVVGTFEVANEVNSINFLPKVLLKSPLGLDEEQSGYVFSIFMLVATTARFLNIFLSFKINVVANILFNFVVVFAGCITLMFFISSNLFAVKIGIALLGLGFSSTYPLIISFVEQRITLTNKISSIMAFSSVLGLCLSPYLVGHFIDANPVSFIYITLTINVIVVFSFTFLYVMEILRLRKL